MSMQPRTPCTFSMHPLGRDGLGVFELTASVCTALALLVATPFADNTTCKWIYRFRANPGDAEGRRPAALPGLGT